MTWADDKKHPFSGIAEKLKRSDENIGNLHREILIFFEQSAYPFIPHPDEQGWQDAVDYHKNLAIPPRFGVLAGEAVHHLRSCLDHVIWCFSSPDYRASHENAIEFPVFCEPLSKDDSRRYNRKVGGIKNPDVLSLVGDLQPYKRGDNALDDPICIIHNMDRFDKHREIAIVAATANLTFKTGTSADAIRSVLRYRQGETLTMNDLKRAQRTIKNDAKVMPQVAFPKFGKRKNQFVVPSLTQLQEQIVGDIDMFAGYV